MPRSIAVTAATVRPGRADRSVLAAILVPILGALSLVLPTIPGEPVLAYDWRDPAMPERWRPTAEQLAQCASVSRDPLSLTYCKRRSDGQWIILDEIPPSLIPGAYVTFTDHEGRFCVFAHAPYANDGRSRPPSTTVCRNADGRYVDSDSIP